MISMMTAKANSDRASCFLFISPSAEQSSIMNSVWWPFKVFLNNFIHSFNLPSRSHTIKTFFSSKINFPRKVRLIIENCWTQNHYEFKMVIIYGFKQSKQKFSLSTSRYTNKHS